MIATGDLIGYLVWVIGFFTLENLEEETDGFWAVDGFILFVGLIGWICLLLADMCLGFLD